MFYHIDDLLLLAMYMTNYCCCCVCACDFDKYMPIQLSRFVYLIDLLELVSDTCMYCDMSKREKSSVAK